LLPVEFLRVPCVGCNVVPLSHEKAGTVGPWEAPSVSDLQIIVDHVYGPGVHTVVEDNVWLGLVCFICYCIEYN